MERIWLKSYEAGVPVTVSYPPVPVHHFLEENARRFPRHPAVLLGGPKFSSIITYRQLDGLANRFANALIRLGVRRGDRVAIQLPNFPQFVFAFYAVLKAGAAVVPINPLYKSHDLSLVLKDSGAGVRTGREGYAAHRLQKLYNLRPAATAMQNLRVVR